MSTRLRPRFRLRVDLSADEVMELFARRVEIEAGAMPVTLDLYRHQVEFSMRPADRHFWSPFLNLIIEEGGERGGAVLQGKYGPNVNVWTMFVAAYAALFLAGMVGFILGTSQMGLGQPATGFWISCGCAALALVIYGIGRIGLRLAHPQTMVIHGFIVGLFGEHVVALRDEEAG